MKIYESGENYLETILILQNKNGYVRSVDIAHELSYSKASVSRAMNILKTADYITIGQDGHIALTDKGRTTANSIYERHQLIKKYLMVTLEIDEVTADQNACRIEHILSQECIDKIREFVHKNQ